LEELLELCKRIKELRLVVDFSHLHARSNGALKTEKDFEALLEKVEGTGKKLLHGLHMHASGINYSEKGERNHYNLQDGRNDFRHGLMLKALKKFKVSGVLICESPNLEEDALLMKKYWKKL
jgi:deoxyribonuclease-4